MYLKRAQIRNIENINQEYNCFSTRLFLSPPFLTHESDSRSRSSVSEIAKVQMFLSPVLETNHLCPFHDTQTKESLLFIRMCNRLILFSPFFLLRRVPWDFWNVDLTFVNNRVRRAIIIVSAIKSNLPKSLKSWAAYKTKEEREKEREGEKKY